jgi:hypothetical protein
MILLNFSHPLTDAQRAQIEALTGAKIEREIHLPAQFDHQQPFAAQLAGLMAQAPLTPTEWQNEQILVNPPSLNFIAVMLLAELHGRMGYFAPCLRLRPVKDALPPRFEVAEILNLQALRDEARKRR